MKALVEVTSNHPDPVLATVAWRKAVSGTIFCPQCCKINRACFPRPIDVVLQKRPDHRITGGVAFAGVRTFHRDFIEQIRGHLCGVVLGECFEPTGKIIEEYVTCYNNRNDWVLVRGNRKSEYRTCPTCDAIWPNGWEGSQYVLRSYLTDARVYMNNFSSMFLDEDLAIELDFSPWPDAELEPIAIRDEPIDGQHLPCDPPVAVKHH